MLFILNKFSNNSIGNSIYLTERNIYLSIILDKYLLKPMNNEYIKSICLDKRTYYLNYIYKQFMHKFN